MEPPIGLYEKIINRIHKEERLLVLRRVVIFSGMFILSVIGFIPSLNMLLSDFSKSGFLSFSSLAFSDFSTIAKYWQSFSMVLLQALPAVSLAIFLAVLATFLQSIKSLTRDVKTIIKARA